ncbi:hypothetical protein [Aeromicrobium sp. Sec7.5]|uniref:hypothetical protein n=1 Tax=Aeromicrobium sp. Sec7.5 TaxID=3121276 RepID=UPI002FE4A264
MKSWVVKTVTALVLVVAVAAVGLGLSTPDGEVRDAEADASPSASPEGTTEPAPEPSPAPPTTAAPTDPAALSPVTGTWPGRPAGTPEVSPGVVDWCPAVQVQVSHAARDAVGEEAARAAACRAVAFTFDARYSRLSLPRESYAAADFAGVEALLTDRTRTSTYPPRLSAVVAAPRTTAAREGTGVVLLDGPSPGGGRQFFGPDWSDVGYVDRPVWVDPAWGVVTIDLQRGGSRPQLSASLEASAGVPVWNPRTAAAEKLTVRTSASYVLAGPDWRLNGWTLSTDLAGFSPLA